MSSKHYKNTCKVLARGSQGSNSSTVHAMGLWNLGRNDVGPQRLLQRDVCKDFCFRLTKGYRYFLSSNTHAFLMRKPSCAGGNMKKQEQSSALTLPHLTIGQLNYYKVVINTASFGILSLARFNVSLSFFPSSKNF